MFLRFFHKFVFSTFKKFLFSSLYRLLFYEVCSGCHELCAYFIYILSDLHFASPYFLIHLFRSFAVCLCGISASFYDVMKNILLSNDFFFFAILFHCVEPRLFPPHIITNYDFDFCFVWTCKINNLCRTLKNETEKTIYRNRGKAVNKFYVKQYHHLLVQTDENVKNSIFPDSRISESMFSVAMSTNTWFVLTLILFTTQYTEISKRDIFSSKIEYVLFHA